MRQALPYAIAAGAAICLDQWAKHLVEAGLGFQEPVDVLPFLALYRTYNTGVAFSMLSTLGNLGLIALSIAVIAFVLWLASTTSAWQKIARFGYALILGGAAGNLIDRAVHGHVIDYVLFHTPVWSFAVFNLADAFITVGACLVVLEELLGWRRQRPGRKPPAG